MDDYDRLNLQFLLNADPDTLQEWYDTVDADDIEYASELMDAYKEELSARSAMLNDDVEDLGQAQKFLKRFRL